MWLLLLTFLNRIGCMTGEGQRRAC